MKKIALALFALMFLLLLSSCGPATPLPDETKIKADLMAQNANYFNIAEEDTYLDIEAIEIIRRKSDSQYDEVHVAAKLGNEYYAVDAEYILSYGFYDVGGWCLDYFELTDYQSYATATPVTDELFEQIMLDDFTTCKIINRSQSTDPQGVFHDAIEFAATLEYPYLTANLNGLYTMDFYNDCWHEDVSLEISNYDWSHFIDSFTYRDASVNLGAGIYSIELKLNISDIVQIADNKLQITYSGSSYLYDKTSQEIYVDKEVGSCTTTTDIGYETLNMMDAELKIPYLSKGLVLPWAYTSNIAIHLDRDVGVKAIDLKYEGASEVFARNVSDAELQNAFDRLQELNPQ